MKYVLIVLVLLIVAYPYILAGSLVVGLVARLANRRLNYEEHETDRPWIILGIILWPLLLVCGVIYVLTRRFVRWSLSLIPKLTAPPRPKPRDEWSE